MSNDHDLVQALEQAGHPDLAQALSKKLGDEPVVDDQPTPVEEVEQAELQTESEAIAAALAEFSAGRNWVSVRA